MNVPEPSSLLSTGARAANILEEAYRATDVPRFEVVRELAPGW